jgi:hypothetical protein
VGAEGWLQQCAAAASGMMAANSLAPVWDHLKVLEELAL